ncbi:MAG TPA: SAM-dependent methyltransferase, partial [Planctomycetaceae bacterium]|nr:SAM-dependent methyltransferase [Planctomycetaceae bacterium]
LPDCTPGILMENIATRLRGYELDPFGAWLSQVAVDAVLLPLARKAKRSLPAVVTICDSLKQPAPREGFDLVIGNPPYGRVRLDVATRDCFRRSLFGHANLYGLFTDMALGCAKTDGVIAYVTPTGFLAGEYFKNLRALLGREAPPIDIDFVALRKGVFAGVLQETLLATYRRGETSKPVSVHEITPVNGRGLKIETIGKFRLPKDLSTPWVLPRSRSQGKLVETLLEMTPRLADWGYGVSTGPLVWNRHKTQLSDEPGADRYPLVWAEAVASDGRFIWRAEKKNHALYFQVGPRDNWLVIRAPCVLLQRTTAKEQQRRLIAAALPADFLRDHGAVVIENHLNMLRPLSGKPAVSSDVLAAFLNSTAADRAFRCVSGSVAVSAYELESLPLPEPGELGELSRLVGTRANGEKIDAACARLYGGAA